MSRDKALVLHPIMCYNLNISVIGNLCLDASESECESLLVSLNFGQRCLLKGIVSLAKLEIMETDGENVNAYSASFSKTETSIAKTKNLRQTLGHLFNIKSSSDEGPSGTKGLNANNNNKRPLPNEDDDDFEPSAWCTRSKGKYAKSGKKNKRSSCSCGWVRRVLCNHFIRI